MDSDFSKTIKLEIKKNNPREVQEDVDSFNASGVSPLNVSSVEAINSSLYNIIYKDHFPYKIIKNAPPKHTKFKNLMIIKPTPDLPKAMHKKESSLSDIKEPKRSHSEFSESSRKKNAQCIKDFDQLVIKENLLPMSDSVTTHKNSDSVFWSYCFNFSFQNRFPVTPPIWKKEPITDLLFTPSHIEFPFDNSIEKLYMRIALYNLSLKKRITEFVHFSTHEPSYAHFILQCEPNPDIVLICHVNRIYQGDTESPIIPYFNESKSLSGSFNIAKIAKTIERYKKIKQEFAWSYLTLFDEYGRILSENAVGSRIDCNLGIKLKSSQLFLKRSPLNNAEFIKIAVDTKKNIRKNKTFPGTAFVFHLKRINDDVYPTKRISAQMNPVKGNGQKYLDIKSSVKEVLTIPLQPDLIPNGEYFNSFYIYPISLSTPKHKGVFVEMQVRSTDENSNNPLELIYGTDPENKFKSAVRTPVFYRNKYSKYGEEWKFNLPDRISPTLNVLFRVYQINTNEKKHVKEFIAYTYLPLIENTTNMTIIPDKEYELPLYYDKIPPKYISQSTLRKKSVFPGFSGPEGTLVIKSHLYSSVNSNDPNLCAFFSPIKSDHSNTIDIYDHRFNTQLKNISNNSLIRFLLPLLRKIMDLLFSQNSSMHKISIVSIIYLAKKLNSSQIESAEAKDFLRIWVKNFFHNFNKFSFHYRVLTLLNRNIKDYTKRTANQKLKDMRKSFLECLWFWLEIITKSLQLEFLQENKILNREKFLPAVHEFIENITKIYLLHIDGIPLTLLKKSNEQIANFIGQLFAVLEVKEVTGIIHRFVIVLDAFSQDDQVIKEIRKTFFRIIYCDWPFYFLISKTMTFSPDTLPPLEITKDSSLASILVYEILICLQNNDQNASVIDLFTKIVCKHAFDMDFLDSNQISRIAALYFPIVTYCFSENVSLPKGVSDSGRNFMITIAWILRNIETSTLSHWISNLSPSQLSHFLKFLSGTLKSFQHVPRSANINDFYTFLSRDSAKEFNIDVIKDKITDIKGDIENMISGGSVYPSTLRSLDTSKMQSNKKLTLRRMRVDMFQNSMKNKTEQIKDISAKNLENLIIYEEKLSATIYSHVFDIVKSLLLQFGGDHRYSQMLFQFLLDIIHYPMTKNLYSIYMEMMNSFLVMPPNLFTDISNAKEEEEDTNFVYFVEVILQFSCRAIPDVLSRSSCFLYLLAIMDYQSSENKTMDRVKNYLLVALHRKGWMIHLQSHEMNLCKEMIMHCVDYCKHDDRFDEAEKVVVEREMDKMVKESTSLIHRFMKISNIMSKTSQGDPSLYEDLILEMSNLYNAVPIYKIDWLKKLVIHQQKMGNYLECGECFISISQIILNSPLLRDDKEFDAKKYLQKAIENLKKGQFFERTVWVYNNLLFPLLLKEKEFARLAFGHSDISSIYNKIFRFLKSDSRHPGSYYLVSFSGAKFKDANGVSFVYHTEKPEEIGRFSDSIIKMYSAMTNVPISLVAEIPDDPKDGHYVSIVFLRIIENSLGSYNLTSFEKSTRIQHFRYEKRYGSSKEKFHISQQQKAVYQISVEHHFPHVKTRQKIASSTKTVYSAVMTAAQDILSRSEQIEKAATKRPVIAKNLTSLLSGSILSQVNGGIKHYFEGFYEERVKKTLDAGELRRLEEAIVKFMQVCKLGLEVFYDCIKAEKDESDFKMYNTLCEYYKTILRMVRVHIKY